MTPVGRVDVCPGGSHRGPWCCRGSQGRPWVVLVAVPWSAGARGPCAPAAGIVLHPHPGCARQRSPLAGCPRPLLPAELLRSGWCLGSRIQLLQLVAVQADRQRARVALDYTARAAAAQEAGDAGTELLSVPGRPSPSILGAAPVPEPRAELGIAAESRVLRGEPGASTAHGSSHAAGLGQLGLAPGTGIQRSQFCPWLFMGSRPGSLAFARVPWHQNICRRDGKTPEHQGWRALTAGGAQQSQFPPGRWPHCRSPVFVSLAAAIPAWLEGPEWGAVPFPACPTTSSGQSQSRETRSDLA